MVGEQPTNIQLNNRFIVNKVSNKIKLKNSKVIKKYFSNLVFWFPRQKDREWILGVRSGLHWLQQEK